MAPPKLRILFSEDHPDTREMTCIILENEGFEVVCPDTSTQVLSLAEKEQFDAFLLDSWTPGLDGIELCQRIRVFDSRTPIVFYSAAAYDGDRKRALAAGAQAYIAKPASMERLVNTIRSIIQETNKPESLAM